MLKNYICYIEYLKDVDSFLYKFSSTKGPSIENRDLLFDKVYYPKINDFTDDIFIFYDGKHRFCSKRKACQIAKTLFKNRLKLVKSNRPHVKKLWEIIDV